MTAIHWTDEEGTDSLGWALYRIRLVLPFASKPRVSEDPGQPKCFRTSFHAPVNRKSDYRKATEVALPQLMPMPEDGLIIYGRVSKTGAQLAAFRAEEVTVWSLQQRASKSWLRISETWCVRTPGAQSAAKRNVMTGALAVAVLAVSIVALQVQYVAKLESDLEAMQVQEQESRAAALALARQRGEADLWGSLQKARAPERLPASVLYRIAELSRLTPNEAAWTRIDWTPEQITIEGRARDPLTVLSALSTIKGSAATFSKPLVRTDGARQQFEVRLTAGAPK